MDLEIQKRWVEALRSGNYNQTCNVLNDGKGGYCCLGVLTDLYIQDRPTARWENLKDHCILVIDEDSTDTNDLPEPVARWAGLDGLTNESFHVPTLAGGGNKTLIDLNDNQRLSFNRIADEIEKYGVV